MVHNYFKHRFLIFQHLIIPKPQNGKALRFQKCFTRCLIPGLFIVLATIEFDDQCLFQANKVNDIRTDGMLTTKLKCGKPFGPQMMPQAFFRVRHIPAQRFRILFNLGVCKAIDASPFGKPPCLPLPLKGEGSIRRLRL